GAAQILYSPEAPKDFRGVHVPALVIDETSAEVPTRFSGDLFRGTILEASEAPVHHPNGNGAQESATVRTAGTAAFWFDLFRNTFLRLSCAAERRLEAAHGLHHGYCPDSLPAASYLKPVVNYLFEALKIALKAVDPRLNGENRRNELPPILPTHD